LPPLSLFLCRVLRTSTFPLVSFEGPAAAPTVGGGSDPQAQPVSWRIPPLHGTFEVVTPLFPPHFKLLQHVNFVTPRRPLPLRVRCFPPSLLAKSNPRVLLGRRVAGLPSVVHHLEQSLTLRTCVFCCLPGFETELHFGPSAMTVPLFAMTGRGQALCGRDICISLSSLLFFV